MLHVHRSIPAGCAGGPNANADHGLTRSGVLAASARGPSPIDITAWWV